MYKIHLIIFFSFFLTNFAFAFEPCKSNDENCMNIVSGIKRGTYNLIVNDIISLTKDNDFTFELRNSNTVGAIENICKILSTENAGIGIIQSDVIDIIRNRIIHDKEEFLCEDGYKLSDRIDRLKLVHPLYNEEVHLLARGVDRLGKLKDKKIYIGSKGSGTSLTAESILSSYTFNDQLFNYQPVYENQKNPIDQLKNREVDALFFVGGQPISLFENILEDRDLNFIPIFLDPAKHAKYKNSQINTMNYSAQRVEKDQKITTVSTVSVQALLVAYDFNIGSSSYMKHRCNQVQQLKELISSKLYYLQTEKNKYHPKWDDVNLDRKTERFCLN